KACPGAPLGAQRPGGRYRRRLGCGERGEEVIEADDSGSREGLDRAFINQVDARADGRWTDHAGVQHARDGEIMHVDVGTGALRGHIRARQRLTHESVVGRILERCLWIEFEVEPPRSDQLREADGVTTALWAHGAVYDFEIFALAIEATRRKFDQRLACGCGGLPDLHAAALYTVRAGRASLIGRQSGVSLNQFNLVHANAKLFCRYLPNGDAQSLAQIDFAAINR